MNYNNPESNHDIMTIIREMFRDDMHQMSIKLDSLKEQVEAIKASVQKEAERLNEQLPDYARADSVSVHVEYDKELEVLRYNINFHTGGHVL